LLPEAQAWGAERGVALTLFSDWSELVLQTLHWSATPSLEGATMLPGLIEQRLIEVEASEEALASWAALTGAAHPTKAPQEESFAG
jgi:hypothetical protein